MKHIFFVSFATYYAKSINFHALFIFDVRIGLKLKHPSPSVVKGLTPTFAILLVIKSPFAPNKRMKNKQSKNTFFVAHRLLRCIFFERNFMLNNEVRVIIVSGICEIDWYSACFK